jgi:cytochrome c oxidase assembly factor CtaG
VKLEVDAGWTFAPVVVVALVAYVWLYVARWRKVDGPPGRLALWLAGVGLIGVALLSPVDRVGEQLASAHMVQHLLLTDLAPIALILALTKVLLRPVTKRVHEIEKKAGPLAHPAMGVIAYVGAMWLWHVPALYDAALKHPLVHVLEHLSFAAAGGLYWWHLLSPIRSRLRLGGMGPILYMASTKILVGFLGVLLAFAPDRLYDAYGTNETATRWGLSVLDDQHVAGLIMGIEQSIVMGIGLAFLFTRMLTESEQEEQRAERYESV